MVPKSSKEVWGVTKNALSVLRIWVMEEFGIEESWVKSFNVKIGVMVMNDINVEVLSDEVVA